jgi:hypothetical protein
MRVRDVYVPISLVGVGVVLMLLQAALLPADTGGDQLQRVVLTSVRIFLYVPVLLAGMGLSAMFGYPFTPAHWSALQLLAAALGPAALRDVVGCVAGDFVGMIASVGLFLGLIGYFFNEEAMDALIAIFLVVTTHAVVTFLLMPLFTMFLV